LLELYFMPSPNTWKVSIMLEECELAYRLVPVNVMEGEQHRAEFVKISPNGRIPAIVDTDGPNERLPIFESGAILLYLAEKTGRFLPAGGAPRYEALQWLFWQVSGLGPMAGQAHVFRQAKEPVPAAIERYNKEVARLYAVLDRQLTGRDFIAGDYGVADISCFGWVWFHHMHGQDLTVYPNIQEWFDRLSARPAVQRGKALALDMLPDNLRGALAGKEWPASQ
jgi:GSH-dependent disulfide-bond oxidoreductase